MDSTPNEPTDVNERVEAEWVEETTPYERVREVMNHSYEGRSVADIADTACTTPKTARKHLRILADDGYVDEVAEPGRTGTQYRRAPASLILEQAHDILERVDATTLLTETQEMQDELAAYRERFDADSPEDAVLQERGIDAETLTDWQTTRRNLGFAKVALALSEAKDGLQTERAV